MKNLPRYLTKYHNKKEEELVLKEKYEKLLKMHAYSIEVDEIIRKGLNL